MHIDTADEDATIPIIATIGQKGFGGGTVWFFKELLDCVDGQWPIFYFVHLSFAAFDVAIACVGEGRLYAEGGNVARFGSDLRALQGGAKGRRVKH